MAGFDPSRLREEKKESERERRARNASNNAGIVVKLFQKEVGDAPSQLRELAGLWSRDIYLHKILAVMRAVADDDKFEDSEDVVEEMHKRLLPLLSRRRGAPSPPKATLGNILKARGVEHVPKD